MADAALRVALFTYSSRPRGGVVHALQLAEALAGSGQEVRLFALEKAGRAGFFRPTTVPATFIPVADRSGEPIDERIGRYIEAYVAHLELALAAGPRFDVYHAEDCISANALLRLRDAGRIPALVRTVHHVDDFTSASLVACQRRSIVEPDVVLVVSEWWRRLLAEDWGVSARVVHNGVDLARFRPPADGAERERLRAGLGLEGSVAVLAVGGVEPRKNTLALLRAFVRAAPRLAAATGRRPLLVIAGGETLFDYRAYRDDFDRELAGLLASGRLAPGAVRLLGPVEQERLTALLRATDVFAFPSLKEGWGLVVLEAQASGLPVVASGISVLREYLVDGENALLVPPDDEGALAGALVRVAADGALADRLRSGGFATARRFDWRSSAERHLAVYRGLAG